MIKRHSAEQRSAVNIYFCLVATRSAGQRADRSQARVGSPGVCTPLQVGGVPLLLWISLGMGLGLQLGQLLFQLCAGKCLITSRLAWTRSEPGGRAPSGVVRWAVRESHS